jgi:hypothetical protein
MPKLKVQMKSKAQIVKVSFLNFDIDLPLSVLHQNSFHLVFIGQFSLLDDFYFHLILRGQERFLLQFFQLPGELCMGLFSLSKKSSFSLISLSINSSSLVTISAPNIKNHCITN